MRDTFLAVLEPQPPQCYDIFATPPRPPSKCHILFERHLTLHALEDSNFGNVVPRYQGRSKVLVGPEHNLKFAEKIASIAIIKGKVGSFLFFLTNFLLF